MKKSLILALVAVVFAYVARAIEVTPDMAMTAANAWVARNAAFGAGGSAQSVRTVCDTNAAQTVLWHQVTMSGGGCLIVAPVTEIEPVVAALESDPGEIPAAHPLRAILAGDIRKRLRFLGLYPASSSGASLLSASPVSDVAQEWAGVGRAKWRRLGVGGGASLMAADVGVTDVAVQIGIVDGFEKGGRFTHWDQEEGGGGKCYNFYTPSNAPCGCVATAAAAVLQFFGAKGCLPGKPNAECTYNDEAYEATFGKPASTIGGLYDWSLFDDCTTRADYNTLSEEQREMLGRVTFDLGVGLGMSWADDESGALDWKIENVYRTQYGFKKARYVGLNVQGPSDKEVRKLIYAQCWAGVPVCLGIEAHEVVACGYGIDAEGVERVRVFMGWGGSGDAWYALPYIDTKSTVGGPQYLSEIVDGVITMISYDTEDIVPVVGQISGPEVVAGVPVTVRDANGARRVVTTDANGYFATRVPAASQGGTGTLECNRNKVQFTIGKDAASSTSASRLVAAIPDWFVPWKIFNATVCSTLESAIDTALAENKAVLRVSGTNGDTNTLAVIDYLISLDTGRAGDGEFTNRFVYIYSEAGTAAGDLSPSIGVFVPQEMDAADRWIASNGMLAYDWGMDAESDLAGLQSRVQAVLDVGWDLYQRRSGNSVLNIVAPSFEPGEALFTISYEGATNSTVRETPAAGTYVNAFRNGQDVTVAPVFELTNETAGVVLSCSGWVLKDTLTGDVIQSGTGSPAVFQMETNRNVSLIWSVATNAVKITIKINDKEGYGNNSVSPGSGWYPYGTRVTFTAWPDTAQKYYLASWTSTGDQPVFGQYGAEGVYAAGPQLVTEALAPVTVQANFARDGSGTHYTPSQTYQVTVVSYVYDNDVKDVVSFSSMAVAPKPTTTVMAVPGQSMTVADGGTVSVPAIDVGFTVPLTVLDTTGGVWRCIGWTWKEGEPKEGEPDLEDYKTRVEGAAAGLNVSARTTLYWFWKRDVSGGGDDPGGDDPATNVFDIVWNDDLSNLSKGYSTNLLTAAVLDANGWTVNDLTVTAPTGWIATVSTDRSGNAVATLARDDAALAAAMESCELIVTNAANDTLAVEATITGGLRGFWYVLYGSDDLTTWEPVKTGTYESGTPAAQAQGSAENPVDKVELSVIVTPGDSAAGPKRFYKVVSGSTSEPLAE